MIENRQEEQQGLALLLAQRFPQALTQALKQATEPCRPGGSWWEGCDRVELRRPVAWRGGALFLLARFKRGGEDSYWYQSSAGFELSASELNVLAEQLEAGGPALLARRHPLVAFIKSEPL